MIVKDAVPLIAEPTKLAFTLADEPIMSDEQFYYLVKLAFEQTGIVLNDSKKGMVYGRIMKRIRRLQLVSFEDYCNLLRVNENNEMAEFINVITTNLTAFFREDYHFKFLKNVALNELKLRNENRQIRIWSAGCSTGQEPYSIAMCVKEQLPYWDCKILATDLDSSVLTEAKTGVYDSVLGIPKRLENKYCEQLMEKNSQYCMTTELKNMVTFKQLNLLRDWPMKGTFDAIFCRNVLIYFNEQTKLEIIRRFYSLLKPGGYLFIGHSESLQNSGTDFQLLGQTIYQRVI